MALLIGCQKEEIRVYNAPKDEPPPAQAADGSGAENPHEAVSRLRAQLSWKLPPGWKDTGANGVNQATFLVPGAGGKDSEVGIAQLPNMSGRDATLVNLWRLEAGLPELKEPDALKELRPVDVGGETGSIFEVAGNNKSGPVKIVTAMVHHPDGSWFYKLSGDPAVVDAQKATFVEFLKSIQIKEAPAEVASADPPEEMTQKFNWQVPADWKAGKANEMQVARFSVPGKAEVFVSVFSSDTGGKLANVNRWRKQIGLGPVESDGLAPLVSPLDPANSEAILVDMTNNDQRLIGAIVPREGRYWFYKLLGDAASVESQKEAFVAFAKSNP
jgi:hypothetical protein